MKFYTLNLAVADKWPPGNFFSCKQPSSRLFLGIGIKQWLMRLRLLGFLMTVLLVEVSASSYAQKVTLREKNSTLVSVLKKLRSQTGYDFLYDSQVLQHAAPVNVMFSNLELEDALSVICRAQQLTYSINNKIVLIELSNPSFLDRLISALNKIDIKGRVIDKTGTGLEGASVTIKGTRRITKTDQSGSFSFAGVDEKSTLVISSLGYLKKEVPITNATSYTIVMEQDSTDLGEVVITGIVDRKKETFTGSSVNFTGEQIRQLGNRNVFESLKVLDPAFVVIQNNLQGSNPNVLPVIELRGKTTLTTDALNDQFGGISPNQPLFILDGFPSTLETIYNLDLSRIKNITILHDAATTALYGSEGANGVVVVETIQPTPGKLSVNYSTSANYDLADLSSFNLMNATEKLEFERLYGLFSLPYPMSSYNPYAPNDDKLSIYNAKLRAIQGGANTDWTRVPLRNGLNLINSIGINGGNQELSIGANVSYSTNNSVMKGTQRNIFGSSFNVRYKKGKFNLNSTTNINSGESKESPYGIFSNYALANPYYRPYAPDGSIPKFLELEGITSDVLGYTVANPLYESTLNNRKDGGTFSIGTQVNAIFELSPEIRLSGGFQFNNSRSSTTIFRSPDNAEFANTDDALKGTYNRSLSNNNSYNGNLTATYAKYIADAHQINLTIRGNIKQADNYSEGFRAVGFPAGAIGNPSFSYGYPINGRPSTLIKRTRGLSAIGSISYSYKQRYNFDANLNIDGTTAFGYRDKFTNFWSFGTSWNIAKEKFMQNIKWINTFRLYANYGISGNASLGSFQSGSYYNYLEGNDVVFGQSSDLTTLGNPDLKPQNTAQLSTGIALNLWNGRVNLSASYYVKKTDPLVVSLENVIPSSVGISAYPINLGQMTNEGWSYSIQTFPIRNGKGITWQLGINGSRTNSFISNFGTALGNYNKEQQKNSGLRRFIDEQNTDAYWTVISKGIDPATGREIYQRLDGTETLVYSIDDIVPLGNSVPTMQGALTTALTYKNFTLNLAVQYSFGSYEFNSTAIKKIENTNAATVRNNLDKRALYLRWKQPGDISQYKAITESTVTPNSSRFLQKNNYFNGTSIGLTYRAAGKKWMKALGMSGISFSPKLNDVFRIESIQTERGTNYPFIRSFSFALSGSF